MLKKMRRAIPRLTNTILRCPEHAVIATVQNQLLFFSQLINDFKTKITIFVAKICLVPHKEQSIPIERRVGNAASQNTLSLFEELHGKSKCTVGQNEFYRSYICRHMYLPVKHLSARVYTGHTSVGICIYQSYICRHVYLPVIHPSAHVFTGQTSVGTCIYRSYICRHVYLPVVHLSARVFAGHTSVGACIYR